MAINSQSNYFEFIINVFRKKMDYAFEPHHIFIFLIFIFIPLILFFSLTIISTIIYNRYQEDKFTATIFLLDEHINTFLINTIFTNVPNSTLKKSVNEFKKKHIGRNKQIEKYVFEKIIHIKENISDIYEHKIILMYKYFKFHELTNQLIKKNNWQDKSEAFYHYQSLDYKIKKGHIKKYLNSKNPKLKSNAIIAYISLSDEKFSYLDNFEYPISKADELKILNIIYKKKTTVPKNIDKWLENKNNSIIAIALKLMIRYKHKLTIEQTRKLLLNENDTVRKEIINATRQLFNFEANEVLLRHYYKETNDANKILTLKTLSEIGNTKIAANLKKNIPLEGSIDIKFALVHCVYTLDNSIFNHYNFASKNEEDVINKMLLHVKNPYLN